MYEGAQLVFRYQGLLDKIVRLGSSSVVVGLKNESFQ
jgi:hypothetical protein